MTTRLQLDTGLFALAFPRNGKLEIVINSQCNTEKEAQLLLFDRVENEEAFPHEVVVKLGVNLQWFSGNQTTGAESFPAHLSPIQIN
jgi:hypothetical protein